MSRRRTSHLELVVDNVATTPRILAIDPGLTTGVAARKGVSEGSAELEGRERAYQWLAVTIPQFDYVVIEEFTITPDTHKKSAQPDASFIIGMVEWACIREEVNFEIALRSYKAHAPDSVLKRLNRWKGVKQPHANDAMRHLTSFEIRHKFIDLSTVLGKEQ